MQTAHATHSRWRPAMPWFAWVLGMCLWVAGACSPGPGSNTEQPDAAGVEGGEEADQPGPTDGEPECGVDMPCMGDSIGEPPADGAETALPSEAVDGEPSQMAVPGAIPDIGGGEDPVTKEKKPAVNEAKGLPKAIFSKVDESCGRDAGVGQKAKNFNLKTPDGKDISLSKYRGRVVLLNFWGTWCKPCLKELPEFSRLYRRYRKHGLTLVAVATDEDADTVAETIKAKKISAKVAIAGQELADKYGARPFPFTFIVDGKGTIVAAYNGYKEKCMGKLEQDLREQLEKRNE